MVLKQFSHQTWLSEIPKGKICYLFTLMETWNVEGGQKTRKDVDLSLRAPLGNPTEMMPVNW